MLVSLVFNTYCFGVECNGYKSTHKCQASIAHSTQSLLSVIKPYRDFPFNDNTFQAAACDLQLFWLTLKRIKGKLEMKI